jgi:flagellar protein FliO/FliZ
VLSRFGIEASQAAQYVIAFVIILVLVALFGLVLRRLTGGRLMLPGQDRGRARQPRLGIVDIYDLDRQRQLILLRRDNVEHLLLIGGPNDVVIETNIVRVAGARLPAAPADAALERTEPTFERPLPEPARPQIEPNGRPSIESQLAARLGSLVGRPGGDKFGSEEGLSPISTASAPAPARVEPVLKPSAVKLATPPASAPSASPAPTPLRPTLGNRSESAAPPVRPVPPAAPTPSAPKPPAPEPQAARVVPRPEPRPVPPSPPPAHPVSPARTPPPPAPERNADAAVLSDMARQLEEALKRPPAPPTPTPNRVQPAPEDRRREEDDLLVPPSRPAPGPRTGPVRPESARPESARPEPVRPEPARPEPAKPEPIRPEPVRPEPPRPDQARPEPRRAEPPRPAPPPPQRVAPPPPAPPGAPPPSHPSARQVDDPFSVEEIEAEFARLLGRPSGGNGKG